MEINDINYTITTNQYDYGVPIHFDAGVEEGFSIGDRIVFCFDSEHIDDKTFIVDKENFSFDMALKKSEADTVFSTLLQRQRYIPYSVKRYKHGEFLETIVNSKITFKNTVKWEGEDNGETQST
jgi:hypothetical protein